jgi:glycosyltransferase involved in cell wall biosynthesis
MLSIIIPTLNEEKNLPKTLEGIKNQTYADYEIIVADKDSQDKTREIAAGYGCRITGGGLPAVGRNKGASIAKGDYLLFLDADIEIKDPRFLEKMMVHAKEHNVLVGTSKGLPSDGKFIDSVLHGIANAYMLAVQYVKPHAWGPCILVTKDIFDRTSGFDVSKHPVDDNEFVHRASQLGKFRVFPLSFYVSVRKFAKDGRLTHGYRNARAAVYKLLFNKWKW